MTAKTIKRLRPKTVLRTCAVILILALTPLVFSASNTNPAVQDACAKETGSCCQHGGSICELNQTYWDHYYVESGPC